MTHESRDAYYFIIYCSCILHKCVCVLLLYHIALLFMCGDPVIICETESNRNCYALGALSYYLSIISCTSITTSDYQVVKLIVTLISHYLVYHARKYQS